MDAEPAAAVGGQAAGKVARPRGEGDAPLVEGVGREEHLDPHLPQPAGHLGHPGGVAGEVAVGDDLPPGISPAALASRRRATVSSGQRRGSPPKHIAERRGKRCASRVRTPSQRA